MNDDSIVYQTRQTIYNVIIEINPGAQTAFWIEKRPSSEMDTTDLESILSHEYEEGFRAKFQLYENGEIDSLVNWLELQNFVDSVTANHYNQEGYSSEEIEKIKPYMDLKQSKDRLLNDNLKGAFIYHNFYGFINEMTNSNPPLLYLDLNDTIEIIEANVQLEYPNDNLVDYMITYDYLGGSDQELISLFENLIDNRDFGKLKSMSLTDTVFYRYNLNKERLDYVLMKRYIDISDYKGIHELELSVRHTN